MIMNDLERRNSFILRFFTEFDCLAQLAGQLRHKVKVKVDL